MYLTLAARKGHAKAEQLLKKFSAEIPVEDQEKAKEMANGWLPRR